MEDNKICIVLELEFSKGAITLSDMEDETSFTDSDIINNDKEICKLNSKIGTMYSSYFEFDSHDEACWFNNEQFDNDKLIILELVNKLKKRINELNDGNIVIEDRITPELIGNLN